MRPRQRQSDTYLDRVVIVVGEAVRVRLGLVVCPHDKDGEAGAEEKHDEAVYTQRIRAAGCGHGYARHEDAKEDNKGVLALAGC